MPKADPQFNTGGLVVIPVEMQSSRPHRNLIYFIQVKLDILVVLTYKFSQCDT